MWRAITSARTGFALGLTVRLVALAACVLGIVRFSGGDRAFAIFAGVVCAVSLVVLVARFVSVDDGEDTDAAG